jgi:hypothetical protein
LTVDPRQLKERVYEKNYKRLLVWASVGADVTNGLWAMYGTRLGVFMTNLYRDHFNFTDVRDFDWHDAFWEQSIKPQFSDGGTDICEHSGWMYNKKKLESEIFKLGELLRSKLGMEIAELDENGSRFFKESWINPPRLAALVKESDVENSVNGH